MAEAFDQLTRCDSTAPPCRVAVHRRVPGDCKHPLWFYRDEFGVIRAWSLHNDAKLEVWGYR